MSDFYEHASTLTKLGKDKHKRDIVRNLIMELRSTHAEAKCIVLHETNVDIVRSLEIGPIHSHTFWTMRIDLNEPPTKMLNRMEKYYWREWKDLFEDYIESRVKNFERDVQLNAQRGVSRLVFETEAAFRDERILTNDSINTRILDTLKPLYPKFEFQYPQTVAWA